VLWEDGDLGERAPSALASISSRNRLPHYKRASLVARPAFFRSLGCCKLSFCTSPRGSKRGQRWEKNDVFSPVRMPKAPVLCVDVSLSVGTRFNGRQVETIYDWGGAMFGRYKIATGPRNVLHPMGVGRLCASEKRGKMAIGGHPKMDFEHCRNARQIGNPLGAVDDLVSRFANLRSGYSAAIQACCLDFWRGVVYRKSAIRELGPIE